MNALWSDKHRALADWRDYWLTEARLQSFDAAKVLAVDIIGKIEKLSYWTVIYDKEAKPAVCREAVDDWCMRYPAMWRASALADLSLILKSDLPIEQETFKPTSKTGYLDHTVQSATSDLPHVLELTNFAIFGNNRNEGEVTSPSVLADWDQFVVDCHAAALARGASQNEHTL